MGRGPEQEAVARERDASDPLRAFRERFLLPRGADGEPVVYFAGNSLGLQPRAARAFVEQELEDWAGLGVRAHLEGRTPWYSYHEIFREEMAGIVGARPDEVVLMNALTVNLHLLMASFYRPTPKRHRILIEHRAFPSDAYAVETQARHHGYDPREAVIVARPRAGEALLRTEDLEALLAEHGETIALVLLGGVSYFTGQLLDMPRIAAAARHAGAVVAFDLAHAAGNVPLALHDWDVDFAAWCSYKYLNGGPGAAAGVFVHERHGRDPRIPRLAGWWGNDPETRFEMHREDPFVPRAGADGWQVSNPPILSMAPLRASLALFAEAGMPALREKSVALTGYLLDRLDALPPGRFEILTPREPAARGCQVSLRVLERPREVFRALEAGGVVADFREPDVIRAAPVPLYNTFHDVFRFAEILARAAGA